MSAPKPLKKNLALALAGIAFTAIASQTVQDGALGPLLATELARRSVKPFWVGVVVGAPSLSIAMLSLLSAKLYQSIGPRLGVSLGAFLTIACLLFYPFDQRTFVWFLLSLIIGVAMAVRWVMGETWLIHSAPKHACGKVVGMQEVGIGLANAAGPALIALTGTAGKTPFLACVAIMAAAGFVALLIKPPNGQSADLNPGAKDAKQPARISGSPLVIACAFACGALETAAHGFLPTLVTGNLWDKISPLLSASVFNLGGIASQIPLGILIDRIGTERMHRKVFVLLFVVGCGLAWTLSDWIGCLFIFAAGAVTGCLYTLAVLSTARSPERLAAMMAKVVIAYTAGGFFGPVTIGGAEGLIGPPALGWMVLAGAVGLMGVQYSIRQE